MPMPRPSQNDPSARTDTRAFTLLELLVVIAVIIVLASIGFPVMQKVRERQKVRQAEAEVQLIQTAISRFQDDFGDAPSLRLLEEKLGHALDASQKSKNLGSEVLVACLFSELPKQAGKEPYLPNGLTGSNGEKLIDLDGDGLMELPDPWKRPYVYFPRSDYAPSVEHDYTILLNMDMACKAKPKTNSQGVYYRLSDYQIWSCGLNEANDTNCDQTAGSAKDDDIRNWVLK